MRPDCLLDHLSALLDAAAIQDGGLHHEASGTHLLRHHTPSALSAAVYRPLLCLVLQGAKEVRSNTRTITVAAGQSLIVSHTLPVMSRITTASAQHPYVALVFPLDLDLLRGLIPALPIDLASASVDPFSIRHQQVPPALREAFLRYYQQCAVAAERDLLAPITAREIHARLLMDGQAPQLRRLLWQDNTASRIHLATQAIVANLAAPFSVSDLAERVGMSNSTFFEQFRAVTGTSPLQYQKDLRLLTAREALRTTDARISDIAFGVGYESAAQFSREYARKFGLPPRRDRTSTSLGARGEATPRAAPI